MNVLITGAASRLGQAIAAELSGKHRLRLTDASPVSPPEKTEFLQADPFDAQQMWQAVRGMDAVVHVGAYAAGPGGPPGADEAQILDLCTRGTHVLLSAAVEARVRRCLYAGTLTPFDAYPLDVYISEMFKPLPLPQMQQMSCYLGELTCREFARTYPLQVTILRLGTAVLEEEVAGQEGRLDWVDLRDAGQAFACALPIDHSGSLSFAQRFGVYHVCADIPNPRYLIARARGIGYRPAHNFTAHWPQVGG
ncbi:MAG: NAD(P)-dependent oxidoreductase [Candidatus Latescibacterota bacterium]